MCIYINGNKKILSIGQTEQKLFYKTRLRM